MKVRTEEIHSKKMFPGLIMGAPKDVMYEDSLDEMKQLLGDSTPVINLSKIKWTQISQTISGKKFKLGYGSWGHLTGVKVSITDDDGNYDFSLIFNFCPETEKLEDVINSTIDKVDWKNMSLKWDAGDL